MNIRHPANAHVMLGRRCARARRLRASLRAYTAVEVLIAITLFAIGATGVIAMQRASVQGNYDARTLDVAGAIARGWQERLRRDADGWTAQGAPPNTTTWLKNAAAAPAAWTVPVYPTLAPSGNSPAFDLLGRELTKSEGEGATTEVATFCTQVKLETVAPGGTVRLVRSEVRVIWQRNGSPMKCIEGVGFDPLSTANLERYRTLSTITLIRGNFR
jgi:type IV pilus assembly protein PilV